MYFGADIMPRSLRYAVLVPLSIFAFFVLFGLPGIDLGAAGGLATLVAAWMVWYLLWKTMHEPAAAAPSDDSTAPISPGEQRAWIGLIFTATILAYYALRGGEMVADDGTMAHGASAIGRHIGTLVAAWVVVMSVLRKRWRDAVEADERDRTIQARATSWARCGLAVFVLALAVTFAFLPLDHLQWAKPMVISNLLMVSLIGSSALEYVVTGITYWRDRR
jgi:hypothetical protein